jgi:crossover junction endodeoxyribonuclease RusA
VILTIDPPDKLINANDRPHYHQKAKLTAAWRKAALDAIGFHPYHYKRAHITVYYRFPTNHRREVSNLQPTSKAIVDGLVDGALIPDDSDEYVTGPDNRRDYPNGPLRVRVRIDPLDEVAA